MARIKRLSLELLASHAPPVGTALPVTLVLPGEPEVAVASIVVNVSGNITSAATTRIVVAINDDETEVEALEGYRDLVRRAAELERQASSARRRGETGSVSTGSGSFRTPTSDASGPFGAEAGDLSAGERPGRLGRYELLAPVGSGGMASIYLGRLAGPAGFRKPVALKVIHRHLAAEPTFVQMFLDEARIASRIDHQNVVQILDFGEEGGLFYIAMEYLQGETVRAIGKRVRATAMGRLSVRFACHVTMAACEGLDHAHHLADLDGTPLGIVHRDVSPQNILVTYAGNVKVLDFGVAKAAGKIQETAPGSLKGKFAYMSPEQVKGQPVDLRADVFALGVNLWEMVAGQRLFRKDSDIETLHGVLQTRVPKLREMRADVPASLDKAIAKATARDPGRRYQTAADLRRALASVIDEAGGAMSSPEVASTMEQWFGNDHRAEEAFVSKALARESGAPGAGGSGAGPPVVERTPSWTSGVRRRGTPISTPSYHASSPENEAPTVVDRPTAALRGAARRSPLLTAVAVFSGLALLAGGGLAYWGVTTARSARSASTSTAAAGEGTEAAGVAAGAASEGDAGLDAAWPAGEADAAAELSADATVEALAAEEADVAVHGDAGTVLLVLDIRPRDAPAVVTLEGERLDRPRRVRLPRSTEPIRLVVSAAGWLPSVVTVVPDRDRTELVRLADDPAYEDVYE